MANQGPAGQSCVRYKDVWSPKYNKYVERCAEFSGGKALDYYDDTLDTLGDDVVLEFEEGGLGQMNILDTLGLSVDNIKDAVTTGGVAAGGAWVSSKLTQTLMAQFPSLNIEYVPEILNMLIGVVAGGLVSRYYRPTVGANLMIGPATVSALGILGLSSDVLTLSGGGAQAGILQGGNQLGLMTAEQTQYEPTASPPTRSYATGGQASIV